ncbi:MAG: Por secretion system protein, partial [Alistipes sp.]|nr:Por secretion system protein [Alistipes sp.]
ALLSIVMLSCAGKDNNFILPDNPNPPAPTPTPEPSEYPLISTDPAFVTEAMTEDITIILNTAGTAADGFSGELYAHTGVLTTESSSTGDWKHVLAEWGTNIPECKLEKKEGNLWHYVIKGGVHAWYNVPDTETVTHIAFVFRSADSKIEVKDNGADIFVELAKEGMSVKFLTPKHGDIYQVGDEITVQTQQQAATNVKLYKNDTAVAETGGATLTYTYTPTEAEDIVFKVVATDGKDTIEESVAVAVLGETENATRPAGVENGVTVNGNEATFVLFAPNKKSVVLLGDFNDYAPSNEYMMKKDGNYFWTTVTGLEEGVEYGYQYLVDGTIKIGDPYATKILDPWNDKWIDASVYPNLKAYPSEYTSDIVSVFEINPTEYQWTATNYERPAENSLAIYELLIRDFTEAGSINAVTAKLDYLDTLGVNAIELMPIQEFDGNDSWGYNPCFYFATDKAYGTDEAYKYFIDECHKRGIAVIVDVVFNHATGQHPYAKMWWDAGANKTNSHNPFFNVDAPHNWSVFHDFNHTYIETVNYFDDVLEYWLEEYNVDGFRFDLTKGFVQNPGNYDAGGYSAERIGILKHYAETIRSVDQDAYIIFEHFCDQSEENELYNSVGALCWNNNQRNGYKQSVLGYTGSSFADFKKGRVNNIETHDEERIAYDAIKYAQSWAKPWDVLTKRLQAAYAFHFLTPYPKMMWQFGELGYDVSIEENGRTGRKPVRWNYFENANRKALYDAMSKVISWRTDHEEYYGQDNVTVHTWSVGDAQMGGKVLVMDKVIVVANFKDAESTTSVNVPSAGEWTNLMTDEKVQLGSSHSFTLGASDYIVLVKE